MVLYSHVPAMSTEFVRRDLRSDRLLRPLRPKAGLAQGIHILDGYADCIALIGSQFEFWDLRESFDRPVVETELGYEPFAIKALDSRRYAIVTQHPVPCLLDLEAPEGTQFRPVYDTFDDDTVLTRAFDAHPGAMTAIAHSRGLSLVNLKGPQLTIKTLGRFSNTMNLSISSVLFHGYEKKLACVQDPSILFTTDIKDKT
jgi:hypothetical protein